MFLSIGTEEPRVMPLLNSHERYTRLVAGLQLHAGLPDCHQLISKHWQELTLTDTVPIKYYSHWLKMRRLVELYEQLLDHGTQLSNDFLLVDSVFNYDQ